MAPPSRVEGQNKQLGIRLLVSDEVLREVSGFVLRSLGEFLLAGKSEPIRVADVLGRTGDPVVAALAGNFAMAFKSFQSRCWNDTVALLEAVLREYPNDGPSTSFRGHCVCEQRRRNRPWNWSYALIRISD